MKLSKVLIDTDPGHDDVMALMLAIKSEKLNIQAITTVCGNSTIENATRNAQFVLDLLNSKIPIYSGASKPLKRELVQAVVHGKSGLDGIDPTNKYVLTNNASEKILEAAKTLGKELTIITLGPLTNIAIAIQKNPDVMSKINKIIMMGGAVRVPGNKNRVAEFNMFVDPEAAEIVFNSQIPKEVVPLDACNHVQLFLEDFEKVKNIKIREVLLKMVKPYILNIYKDEGVKAALMYDPLTIFHYLFTKFSKTENVNICIETTSNLTRGMTVADLRKKPEDSPNVTLVNNIDSQAFTEYFIKVMSK